MAVRKRETHQRIVQEEKTGEETIAEEEVKSNKVKKYSKHRGHTGERHRKKERLNEKIDTLGRGRGKQKQQGHLLDERRRRRKSNQWRNEKKGVKI